MFIMFSGQCPTKMTYCEPTNSGCSPSLWEYTTLPNGYCASTGTTMTYILPHAVQACHHWAKRPGMDPSTPAVPFNCNNWTKKDTVGWSLWSLGQVTLQQETPVTIGVFVWQGRQKVPPTNPPRIARLCGIESAVSCRDGDGWRWTWRCSLPFLRGYSPSIPCFYCGELLLQRSTSEFAALKVILRWGTMTLCPFIRYIAR